MRAVLARVSGRVQGVWFRDTARRVAEGLGITGWVRNLADGRVEALAQGPPEVVEDFVTWLHQGPPRAVILGVEVTEVPVDPAMSGFRVR
jgi:acylphosphatase